MRFERKTVEISDGRKLYVYEFEDDDSEQSTGKAQSASASSKAHEGNLEPEDSERK